MTVPLVRKARLLKQAISRRRPKRRDDSGLTTLEWLLIVAAVAGMAALAVVLVTNVVGETSEQIAGQSARKTSAIFAAAEIIDDADRNSADQPRDAKTYGDWKEFYTDKCDRLELVYVDIDLDATPTFEHGTKPATDSVADTDISTHPDGPEGEVPAILPPVYAHCKV